MELTYQTKIGSDALKAVVNEKSFKESIWALAPLINAPKECSLCGGEVSLETNKRKHIYIKIRCKKCEAFSALGEYEDGSGFWWKDFIVKEKEFEKKK